MRYALALRRGDFAAASAEVRHLADLIRTQGILISEMVAIIIYRTDAAARGGAGAAGADVSGWTVADQDQFDLQRKLTWASVYFGFPGVSPETLRKAADCMPSPCTALHEAAAANRSFGAYAAINNLNLVGELAAARGCEAATLSRVSKSKELPATDALEAIGAEVDTQIPKYLGGQQ